jgi:hypothetical protein
MRIALVTSSVNVLVNDTKFADANAREIQTYLAINTFIDYFDVIYLIDGSNYTFKLIDDFIKAENRSKIITHSFLQDLTYLGKYGKALGELLIYQEFLKITKLSSLGNHSLVKISGRWHINNYKTLDLLVQNNKNLFVQYYPRWLKYRKYVQTCFYKIEYTRLEILVQYGLEFYVSYRQTVPLEAMLHRFLINKKKNYINMEYPDYSGVISGSTGKEIKKDDYYQIQNLLSKYLKQYCFTTY